MDTDAGKQRIIDTISPRWEKPVRPKSSEYFYYDILQNGEIFQAVRVNRIDPGDPTKKKEFPQSHRKDSTDPWAFGVPKDIKTEVHLFKIFEDINQQAIRNGERILIVEGERKVNALHRLGIPATCPITGKWKSYGYPNYIKQLEGAAVVICPDRDVPGMNKAIAIAGDYPDSPWLYANPTSFQWKGKLPEKNGYDIGDWIDGGATKEQILGAIEPRRVDPEPITTLPPSDEMPIGSLGVQSKRGMTTLQKDAEMIREEVGHLLSFDAATQNFYLDGKRLTLGRERLLLSTKYGLPIKAGKEDVMDICVQLAQENTFNSVTDYIDGCQNTQGIELLKLSKIIFGTDDPLQAVFLKKWFIAAVARAYDPGCQADDVVILQGGQGKRKSSFFTELVPVKEWFNGDGLKGSKPSDEEIRKAQRTWIIEIPEIDKTFKKACASELKGFITQRSDWLRQLYEKMPDNYPRNSIMAGTTNEPEFFTDETGNRRYMVIQVMVSIIDIPWIQAHRNSIWAAARDAYRAGEIWHLTQEEKALHSQQNRQWKIEHPWQGAIERYVSVLEEVTVAELLQNAIGLNLSELRGKSEQMQVAGILKTLGFTKIGQVKNNGPVIWRKIAEET
jgi:predicted P-loop ATPase